MRRSRVPVAEKRSTEAKTKYNSSLRKTTSMGPKITKKSFSVNQKSFSGQHKEYNGEQSKRGHGRGTSRTHHRD